MPLKRETSAGYLTNLAARWFGRVVEDDLRPVGVPTGYLPVFFALADGGALTQSALARDANIEQPTMAATLARMERDGLIARRPDPNDKRSALVTLTPAARAKLPAVEAAVMTVNAKALAPLTAAERKAFLAALNKVIAALEG